MRTFARDKFLNFAQGSISGKNSSGLEKSLSVRSLAIALKEKKTQ
jgi:hypothetical protein